MKMNSRTRAFMRVNQQRLGTPVEAITFALHLSLGDDANAIIFLNEWQHGGDLSEWPDYKPAPLPPEEWRIPPALNVSAAITLLFFAWIFVEAGVSINRPFTATIIGLALALPAALLLHAAGIKAPGQ